MEISLIGFFTFCLAWKEGAPKKGGLDKSGVHLNSKRRNGFDITRDILKVCVNSANKTHIVYAANLNSKRVNRYLEFCVRRKLLTKQSNGENFVHYTTTLDGLHFMRNYFGAPQRENVTQIK